MFGFLNVYKPSGLTSHDVVAKLRKILKIKRIGHTGTLDPMAEGVLVVAVGKASRLIEFLDEDKSYRVTLQLGKISDTFDIEGQVEDYSDKKIFEDELLKSLQNFQGEILQTPPAFSAVHYNGKRLYELARQGIIPEDIPKRKVFISKIELVSFNFDNQVAVLDIDCSKGTYIRSIVSDLGQMLECGAVMTALTRTKSGSFNIKDAVKLDVVSSVDSAISLLRNTLSVLPFNKYLLSDVEYKKVVQGQALFVSDFEKDEYVSLVFEEKLCAVAQKTDESRLAVKKVFVQ